MGSYWPVAARSASKRLRACGDFSKRDDQGQDGSTPEFISWGRTCALVFRLNYPSPGDAAAFVASVSLAVVVSLGFRFLYNSSAFWLIDIRGVMIVALSLSLFFSGMVMPLTFFPSWLADIAHVLPFASIMQVPIDVWLGKHHGLGLLGVLALQLWWALVLLGLGRLALSRGTRKLVIQGG